MRHTVARLSLVLLIVAFAILPVSMLADKGMALSLSSDTSEVLQEDLALTDSFMPDESYDPDIPQLISETAVLMDAATGQILFEKNMHRRMYPASITKILTALVALEQAKLSQVITMSERAVFSIERGSSHIALDMDEQITLEQALYGISIASGNDAANGIAEAVGGSLEEFADQMNLRAKEAGAFQSHFVNAHGLPDNNHYSTAYDMARITMAAIHQPEFLTLFSEITHEIPPTNKQPEIRYLHNINCLVNGVISCEGVIAGKTGYTNAAQHTLVTVAKRNERTLIVVVMKSSERNDKYYDTRALFDYGFDQFRSISVPAKQITTTAKTSIEGIEDIDVTYFSEHAVTMLLHKDLALADIEIHYQLPENSNSRPIDLESGSVRFCLAEDASEKNKMYRDLAISSLAVEFTEPVSDSFQGQERIGSGSQQGNPDQNSAVKAASTKVFLRGLRMNSGTERVVPVVGFIVLIIGAIGWRMFKRRQHRRKLIRLREQFKRCDRPESIQPSSSRNTKTAGQTAPNHSTTYRSSGRIDPLENRPQLRQSPNRRQPD